MTILWIMAIFVAAILGFFAAAIAAGSGRDTAYQEGFLDGKMAEQLWLEKKLSEMLLGAEPGKQQKEKSDEIFLSDVLQKKNFFDEHLYFCCSGQFFQQPTEYERLSSMKGMRQYFFID